MGEKRMQGVESGGKFPDSSLSFGAGRGRAHANVAGGVDLQAHQFFRGIGILTLANYLARMRVRLRRSSIA
jgi:hypothetical protein